jgi:hypothetical protein
MEGKNITFHCPPELVLRLERISIKSDKSRSEIVKRMVEVMTHYLEDTEAVGKISMKLLFRDASMYLNELGGYWKRIVEIGNLKVCETAQKHNGQVVEVGY